MNRIIIQSPLVAGNRISYCYQLEGEWTEAFHTNEDFFVEYACPIEGVPEGIAIIPLMCNVLPMAWVYDAEIVVPCLDEEFYRSIPEFKKGYEEMYPRVPFGGKINVSRVQANVPQKSGNTAAFFSGGVDAFQTLIQHLDEKPTLITLWGADVKFEDEEGWKKVVAHLEETKEKFGIETITVKTAFRRILSESILQRKVSRLAGDGWWHGFQHGIGILSHAAPVAYLNGYSTIYFASSFTANDKGKVTCASDPTIDNFLRFCGSKIVHDGYEFCRQDKVHNIVEFYKENGISVPLRVCWSSTGGGNCCTCEKCWRTIFEIAAEKVDVKEFGFEYSLKDAKNARRLYWTKKNVPTYRRDSVYKTAQKVMRANCTIDEIPKELRWFYNIPIKKLGNAPFYWKALRFGKRTLRKIKSAFKK